MQVSGDCEALIEATGGGKDFLMRDSGGMVPRRRCLL
jgi:hypothetical protein